jgi:hypothetical protein
MLGQDSSDKFRLSQDKSGYVRLAQVMSCSGYFRFGQFYQVTSG